MIRLLFFVALLFIAASPATARIWRVSQDGVADAPSIQSAVDSCVSGDVVLVEAGTYFENVAFRGVNIQLKSAAGPQLTTIHGAAADSAVIIINRGESRSCVLEGFTITGGKGGVATPREPLGGGVFIDNAEPTIRNNIITGNDVSRWGGGIFCRSETVRSPLIEGNTIRGNSAVGNGGGIGTYLRSAPTIRNNTIEENSVEGGDGGGIWALNYGGVIQIRENRIIGNTANDHGGGIYGGVLQFPLVTIGFEITDNLIWKNQANAGPHTGDSGGGIWLESTSAIVRRNTIAENSGLGPTGTWGGGLVLRLTGSPVVEHNIIALSPIGAGVSCFGGVTPVFQNNLAWANVPADGAGSCANWYQGNGNVVADPLFCGAAHGDFSLPANSPALTHPSGPIGAFPLPGCPQGVVVLQTPWSSIKSRFK